MSGDAGPGTGDAAQRSSTRGTGDAAQRSSTRGTGDAAQRSSTRGTGDAALDELWGAGTPDGFRRLWAPHRMAYIAGETGTGQVEGGGCPLCRIPTLDDGEGLVLHRGTRVYAVLNLHPYNPGHLMVVPYRHVAGLDELDAEESAELVAVTQQAVRALRTVAAPHGFNVGINLGHVAGGSLADHLHQHVVPRWGGDANFITVVGQTKVIPQLLAETRSRLAEVWPADGPRATGDGRSA